MPYPMVHFAVSYRMAELLGAELSPAFLLGSIAPDSIHMREGTGKSDKAVTHLKLMPRNEVPPDLNVLDFLKSFIVSHCKENDTQQAHFIQGYVSHILTDLYWLDTMFDEFKQTVEPVLGKSGRIELYKKECDQGDYELFVQCAWRPMAWSLLQEAQAYEVRGLLSAEEVGKWRERVLGVYGIIAAKPQFEPQYMTAERLTEFADQAARHMLRQFDQMRISVMG